MSANERRASSSAPPACHARMVQSSTPNWARRNRRHCPSRPEVALPVGCSGQCRALPPAVETHRLVCATRVASSLQRYSGLISPTMRTLRFAARALTVRRTVVIPLAAASCSACEREAVTSSAGSSAIDTRRTREPKIDSSGESTRPCACMRASSASSAWVSDRRS